MGNKISIEDTVFDLKLKNKELQRMANKCAKDEKNEKLKVKQAIQKGLKEQAQIYAQNAIRKKNEQLSYLRMAAKMDAVASKLDGAAKSQGISQSMQVSVKQLNKCMKVMNVEDMTETANEFERLFEDLDVRTEYISGAIDASTATATPANEVDALMKQVADEHALDASEMLMQMDAGPNASSLATADPTKQNNAGYANRG